MANYIVTFLSPARWADDDEHDGRAFFVYAERLHMTADWLSRMMFTNRNCVDTFFAGASVTSNGASGTHRESFASDLTGIRYSFSAK